MDSSNVHFAEDFGMDFDMDYSTASGASYHGDFLDLVVCLLVDFELELALEQSGTDSAGFGDLPRKHFCLKRR